MGNKNTTASSDRTEGCGTGSGPVIRSLNENDVEGLVRCVTACYGDTYGLKAFYDPGKIRSFLRQGIMHSQIAVTQEGHIVGHLGIMLDHTGDITADAIAGFVAPDYRGSDTMFRLGLNLNKVQQDLGLIGVQLYAMMLHNITQRKALSIGGIETGILPAHTPASVRPRGFERTDGNRIPSIMIYVPLHPAPERAVFIAKPYLDTISNLYKKIGYTRVFSCGDSEPGSTPADYTVNKEPELDRIKIKVHGAGFDLPDAVQRLQSECRLEGINVIYIDLPLSDPASPLLVEKLRKLGFFYGGVILERSGSDMLRLQGLLNVRIAPFADIIAGDHGKALFDFVMNDAREVGAV